jgi:hypothetical protein
VHEPQGAPADVHRRQFRGSGRRGRNPSNHLPARRRPPGRIFDHDKGSPVVHLGQAPAHDSVVAQLEQQALAHQRVEQREQRVAPPSAAAVAAAAAALARVVVVVVVVTSDGGRERLLLVLHRCCYLLRAATMCPTVGSFAERRRDSRSAVSKEEAPLRDRGERRRE